jgi:hypothetical protein
LLIKEIDYLWMRPALVANMELQAGHPQKKGNRRGPTYAYNVKELRAREMNVARRAEAAYENFVGQWQPRGPKNGARAPLTEFPAEAPLFATRSPAQRKYSTPRSKTLVNLIRGSD